MTNSKEKYITINVNEEIKNLCPDLEEEQVITLSEIIDNEFNTVSYTHLTLPTILRV